MIPGPSAFSKPNGEADAVTKAVPPGSSGPFAPDCVEKTARDVRRTTRRRFSAVQKVRIVAEGLRDIATIAEL